MPLEYFENQARLYAVGALGEPERYAFQEARRALGEAAERVIAESRRIATALALAAEPQRPHPAGRSRLMRAIRKPALKRSGSGSKPACAQNSGPS